VSDTTQTGLSKNIDLSSAVAAAGTLTLSLPHGTSALEGTVSLVGAVVAYTPPAGVMNTIDRFVYRVQESGGGHSTNEVSVTITP